MSCASSQRIKLSVLLIGVMLLAGITAMPVFAQTQATVSAGDASGLVGTTVEVPVEIEDAEDVGGGELIISYDPEILNAVDVTNIHDDIFLENNPEYDDGQVKIAWAADAMEDHPEGALVEVRLRVLSYEDSTIAIEEEKLYDEDGINEVPSSTENGELIKEDLEEVSKGDINGMGSVNFQDAILTFQNEARLIELGPNQSSAADVNEDGTVDFRDAILIFQYEAGLISDFPTN